MSLVDALRADLSTSVVFFYERRLDDAALADGLALALDHVPVFSGCSWDHVVGDMSSFMLLMRAWSAAVEGQPLPDVVLADDRDAYLDQVLPPAHSDRPGIRLLGADEAASRAGDIRTAAMASRTVQLYFGEAETERLRAQFSAEAGLRLSVNDVLCAAVVSATRQLDGDEDDRNLAIAVDIRHRLDLPPGVIGNLVSDIYLSSPAQATAPELAAQIRAAVGDIAGSHLSIRASRAFLDKIGRSRIGDCVPIGFDLSRRTFTFSSWRQFGAYDIVFDGHRPAYFSPAANVQLPWTSWLVEGFRGTGYLFTVVVPAKLAARLKSPEARTILHRHRAADDELPARALAARKLLLSGSAREVRRAGRAA